MTSIFTNQFALQASEHDLRIVFQDVRGGIQAANEHPNFVRIVSEVVMTPALARLLRDALVEHIKDDPLPGTMQ